MFIYKVYTLFLIICVVKCNVDFDTMCENDYRNMNGNQIDVSEYCSDNDVCIEKCCAEDEMFDPWGACVNTEKMFKKLQNASSLASNINYSNIDLYSWDNNNKTKSEKNLVFVRNRRDFKNCTAEHDNSNDFFILEDGSMRMQDTRWSKSWFVIERLEYCIDFKLKMLNHTTVVKVIVRESIIDRTDVENRALFIVIGSSISSFFLLLVLVVYCMLPRLNLIYLMRRAYTASIFITFLFKIVKYLTIQSLTKKHCKVISPIMYFAEVSSFFWLNAMSHDVWSTFRQSHPECRDSREERMQFRRYSLYAWGVPFLMTVTVTVLDNIDLSNLPIIKPPFDDCFVFVKSVQYYLIIPIGVIIFVNIIFFLLTAYKIWNDKRIYLKSNDFESKQDTNSFFTFIKLSGFMGVNWILELIPPDTPFWLFALTTIYNLLIGVTIFFLFVFHKEKKYIWANLCKRCNIHNDFTKQFQSIQSGTTRSTGPHSVMEESHEIDHLKDCRVGSTTHENKTNVQTPALS